jgi:hypothetical protein
MAEGLALLANIANGPWLSREELCASCITVCSPCAFGLRRGRPLPWPYAMRLA